MLGTRISGGGRFYFLFIYIIINCLSVRPIMAAEVSLTLSEATALTLASNPQLYQYTFVNEVNLAQKQLSELRPSLALEAELENVIGSGPFQGVDSAEVTVAISSVIELGDKRSARISVADARIYQSQWQRQADTLDVLGDLTTSYIEGLSTQNNILLATESLDLSKQLMQTVENRVSQGAAPEAELLRAEAIVAEADIRLSALNERLERQKIQIARFWGETDPQFTQLDGDLFAFEPGIDFDALYERVQYSPAMQVFASEDRLREAEIALARANSRADLSWQVGIRRFQDTDDTALTAGVSIPLFANQRSSANIRSAEANREALTYNRQDSLLRLHAKLYEAWSLREQNIGAVQTIQQRIIPALEQALELTEQAYESGRYQYFTLILAQEELLAAKQRLIDAASNVQLSQALIEQLTSEPLTLPSD